MKNSILTNQADIKSAMPCNEVLQPNTCCICSNPITELGTGNNPFPVKKKGNCCAACNNRVVIPQRKKAI